MPRLALLPLLLALLFASPFAPGRGGRHEPVAQRTGGEPPRGQDQRTFSAAGISFAYPAPWHVYQFPWSSSFATSLAYVSNVPLHRPCVGHPLGPHCRGPILTLPANSALLVWTENGFPGWTFGRARGRVMRIHGQRARLQMLAPQPAWCPERTARMLDVVIARPRVPDNWYELHACLSGPHLQRVKAQVMSVLDSFRSKR